MAFKRKKNIKEVNTVIEPTEKLDKENQENTLPASKDISALAALRKERGMEEKPQTETVKRPVLKKDDPFEDKEDINKIQLYTSNSYSFDTPENVQLQYIQDVLHEPTQPSEASVEQENVEPEEKEIPQEKEVPQIEEVQEDQTEVKKSKKVEKAAKKQKKKEKKAARNKKRREFYQNGLSFQQKVVMAIIGIFLILLAGYSYIVLIYRPMNTVSEDQEVLYDKLIEYADEWDMLSDTEKNELLDIEEDYDSLLSKQRSSLNSYYKEQTGMTLNEIYSELKAQEEEDNDEENLSYLVLSDYVSGWENYTENQRMAIIQYKTLYDDIPKALQTKIDSACKEKTTYNFNSLYREYNDVYTSEIASIPNMSKSYKEEIQNDYQSELNTLQSQYHDMALKETEYREKVDGMSTSNSKYHDAKLKMDTNEAKMKQNRVLVDFFTQILEQYKNTQAYDEGWDQYYYYY